MEIVRPPEGSPVPVFDREQRRRFFVLTGGDGAGKTTLLAEAARRRPAWAVGSYQPTDWLPHPELPHFAWELETHPKSVVHRLTPLTRATLLLDMMAAHLEYWVRPQLEAGRVVLLDSYYYRFYAKEKVRGWVPSFFFEALDSFPQAGSVLFLEIEPERVLTRRERFDTHEVERRATAADFVRFQHRVLAELTGVLASGPGEVVRLDASRAPGEVADALVDAIERRLATRSRPEPG